MQLLNNPPFYVSGQSPEGQQATGETFQQASEQRMQLAQKAAGNVPADVPTVDRASPTTAGFPAGGPAVVECVHGSL
jgi:hypothetical protein